jgi:hypothetical protein
MISHMSPQAAWALKMLGQRTRRRRERAPFVGKRYFITDNLAERAQHTYDSEAKIVRLAARHPRAAVLLANEMKIAACCGRLSCPASR